MVRYYTTHAGHTYMQLYIFLFMRIHECSSHIMRDGYHNTHSIYA